MKRIILPALFIAFLFSSCRTMSYFSTPNDLKNIPGTLYLTNGKTVEGKLVVNTNNMFGSPVKVYVDGEKKPMQFNLGDVEAYEIRNDFYELKEIRQTLGSRRHSFMKRLTRTNSRIHLYEDLEMTTTTNARNNTTSNKYETQYYMQFPNEEGDLVWAVSSSKFVPNFDEKMSKLVEDCRSLATKIANKEEGYFYAQVSLFREKRADVLMNIISEYNKCK